MLLDERLLEGCGDAIATTATSLIRPPHRRPRIEAGFFFLLLIVAALPRQHRAQEAVDAERVTAAFTRDWSDLDARLLGLRRAHGVLYGALVRGHGKVDESQVYRIMTERLVAAASSSGPDAEAERGYATLGVQGAEIIRRTHLFHREVLAIFAGLDAPARVGALDAAVDRYESRPDVALPDVPKDMTILYDHPYTSFVVDNLTARRKLTYPSLTGLVWASHWFQLAVQEPFESADAAERRQGLAVVTERFRRKLSGGTPPDAFPTELPLAPAIAPGLVLVHPRAAAILDNLNMMHDVLMDVLTHPKVGDVRAAIDQAIGQFTDRRARVVEIDDWITMALRHSIFAQGGPALRTMTQSDRNSSGHFQHARGARSIPPGGMR